MKSANVLWVEMEMDSLTPGKPIDGFTAGTFIDMWGRKHEFKEEELPEYVANTKAAIAGTELSDGTVRGLPIDCQAHDNEDAAGWIVDLNLVDGLIRFAVEWTDLGVDLIKRGLRAYFSATIDMTHKLILGGSLTNWPATRDNKTGATLLAPVELANRPGMFTLSDESFEERIERVRQAFYEIEPTTDGPEGYVEAVYEDFAIVERSDGAWRVPYAMEGEGVSFAPESEWVQVRKTWLEAAKERFRKSRQGASNMKDFKLSEADQKSLATQLLPALLPAVVEALGKDGFANLRASDIESAIDVTKLDLGPLSSLIDDRANELVKAELVRRQRDADIASFSKRMTGGDEDTTKGLPCAEADLSAFLGTLDDKQLETAKALLEKIQGEGLVEFSERGHGREGEDKKPLPDELAKHLRTHLEIKGNTVKDWFAMNAASLGAMADYDLSEFEKKE